MGMIEDIMKALERIPVWKRVSALPSEVEALKERIAALEAKLSPATGEQCPICRSHTFKVISSAPDPEFGFAGVKLDTMSCTSCGHHETRQRDPSKG
ncbi:hypothetical protein [Achromobacter xylosoxidans]|uniref:hypothetical protein n=1 Tax=Alcaligenes xylosoxydans xylosoxydans TaxID=85698 RepID=UPI001EEDDC27|nr:hypothetical protein [Achromobacter xylosoxidans]